MTYRKEKNRMRRLAVILLSTLLVLAFAAASAPQSVSAAPCKFKHTVKAGESLIIIANLYQTDWKEIAEANDLKEPYALVVGDVLCIPSGTAPGASPETGTKAGEANLEVAAAFKHFLVVVENFPKNKVYNLRLGDGAVGKETSTFIKIGRLKTDKAGNFEGYFHLPAEYQTSRNLVVCLKDPFTDDIYCSNYENIFNTYMVAYYSCAKPGR